MSQPGRGGRGNRAKPIRLSAHARSYITRRGFSQADVEDAVRTGRWLPARNGRLETSKDFAFNADWNGRPYSTKRVRPVFVEMPAEIVVVTVYTYYF